MSFDRLFGNSKVKDWIKRSLYRLPSSLIFWGAEGVGKTTFARELAKAVNCAHLVSGWNPCDQCTSCRRIDASTFADVTTIVPDGQFIKIDQIRKLVDEAYFRPFEGKKRVYIITQSERMKEQAANALLKTLEEPPVTLLIILTTSNIDALLPTIRSRAVKLAFTPLNELEMQNYLAERASRSDTDNLLLSRLSFGCPGRALEIDLSVYKERRQELLSLLDHLLIKHNRLSLLKAAEALGKKEREEFIPYLDILKGLLRDIQSVSLGVPELVTNHDIASSLTIFAKQVSPHTIYILFNEAESIEANLPRNINRQLALEKTFLSLT